MKFKKMIFRSCCFALLLLFGSSSILGQTDPCSLNAGEDLSFCTDQTEFTLSALAGSQINLSTLQWSDHPLFTIVTPNSQTTNVVSNFVPVPDGCYTFTVTAFCNGNTGTPITDEVEVCFGPPPPPATITVNGDSVDAITVCSEVVLDGNEMGDWYILSNNSNVTISVDANNQLTASVFPFYIPQCRTITIYYEVANEFCTSTDEINITFLGGDEDVRIKNCPESVLCTSEECVEFTGSIIGCDMDLSNVEWNVSAPGTVSNVYIQGGSVIALICMPVDGDYTVTYSVDNEPGQICEGGFDSCTFTKCTYDPLPVPESLIQLFCVDIPPAVTFDDPFGYGWTVSPPQVQIDYSVPGQVTFYNISEEITTVTATQYIGSTSCPECELFRVIELVEGPKLELVSDEDIVFRCGPNYDFNPWDYVEGYSEGSRNIYVVSVPDPTNPNGVQMGRNYIGTNISLDLLDEGKYSFLLTYTREENGVVCEDSILICAEVCDPGQPAAPAVSDLCVKDVVQLIGSIPSSDCADIKWEQIGSGPAIEFVNGTTQSDINPWIRACDVGTVCIEYSFSKDDECFLADTTCFEVINCCDSIPDLSLVCDSLEYCLFINGIPAEDNEDYIVCEGAICSSDYEVGEWINFVVCDAESVENCLEIDSTSCCFTIPVQVPACCPIPEPDVELRCDSNEVCLYINDAKAADFAEFFVCGELCVPISMVGDILTYKICEWGYQTDCEDEEETECCWYYELEVPECCQGPELTAEMVCDTSGLVCLYVNGERAADMENLIFCGDDLCVPISDVGETVNYLICEPGFETECEDEDPHCCTEFSFEVPLCCQGPELTAEMVCDTAGLVCLYVNGEKAAFMEELIFCGDPLCVPISDVGGTVNYLICEPGFDTECGDEDPPCCTEFSFEVPLCCQGPELSAEMVCDSAGLVCLYVNGEKAAFMEELIFCGDPLCVPISDFGETVNYLICEPGFDTECGDEDPPCCTEFTFEVPLCCQGPEINAEMVCDDNGLVCLYVNGEVAAQNENLIICGDALCLAPSAAGQTVNYQICETMFGTECGDEDPPCCSEFTFVVPECCEGEEPEVYLSCPEEGGLYCLMINDAIANGDYLICGGPICFHEDSGIETISYMVCEWGFDTTCFDEDPSCCWEYTFTVGDCGMCDASAPPISFVCEEDEVCLYIDGLPAGSNPDYFVGQASCFPFNMAGITVDFRIYSADDPSIFWDCQETIPECEEDDDCIIALGMTCEEGVPCLTINGALAYNQTDTYTVYGPGFCVDAAFAGWSLNYTVVLIDDTTCLIDTSVVVPNCNEGGGGGYYEFGSGELPNSRENALNDILIYPNPASDVLYLNHQIDEPVSYRIIDLDGKLIQKGNLNSNKNDVISLEKLQAGVYFIEFENKLDKSIRIEKFLKQ